MNDSADEAIVLAGGRGSRLQSVVSDVPKPLADVAGRPFLAWVLDELAASGISRTILATGYLSSQIESYVGQTWKGMSIAYSVESEPLGTGGAVGQAVRHLHGRAVHVINGDTYLRFVPAVLQAAAQAAGAPMAIALAEVPDVSRYGAVLVGEDKVYGFAEKGGSGPGLVNAGCYFLDEEAIAALPRKAAFSLEQEFIAPMVSAGKIAACRATADFIDIGVPDDYANAQVRFALNRCHKFYVDPGAAHMLSNVRGQRRALFLDRDGVINVNHGYVHTQEKTDFVPGIFDLCRRARETGLLLVVVTNQAGIARGYYDEAQFLQYTKWMHEKFAARGAPLLATHYCPHHPLAGKGDLLRACPSRKPNPGMFFTAATNYGIALSESLVLGDKESDLEAGRFAGVTNRLLVDESGIGQAFDWLSAYSTSRFQ
ncbi:MAG: D-glycero-beta-D-manno-heptose 1,7-bisphosphate 7-phosphatase [Pseudoxanthomonas sp.]